MDILLHLTEFCLVCKKTVLVMINLHCQLPLISKIIIVSFVSPGGEKKEKVTIDIADTGT